MSMMMIVSVLHAMRRDCRLQIAGCRVQSAELRSLVVIRDGGGDGHGMYVHTVQYSTPYSTATTECNRMDGMNGMDGMDRPEHPFLLPSSRSVIPSSTPVVSAGEKQRRRGQRGPFPEYIQYGTDINGIAPTGTEDQDSGDIGTMSR